MSQATFSTHEVFNQSTPLEDVDLYAVDRPLVEAVAANGGASAQGELSEFGRHWGSAAMAERGRVANENTPKLRTFDAKGNRRDEVEFHPAYHELMAHSAHAGVHNSTWTADGKPAGGASEVIRASLEPGVYVFEVRDLKNREANFQDSWQLTVEESDE